MKKKRACLWWILGVVFLCLATAAIGWKPYFLKPSDVNACGLDTDCIIVRPVGCGYPNAINASYLEQWDLHARLRKKFPFPPIIGACAPSPPMELFQAECLQSRCRAVWIDDHAILEFPSDPAIGIPTELIFRFNTSSGVETGQATIAFIPNLVTIQSGNPGWEGSLAPETEEQIRLLVLFSRPGYYQIHAEAPASQGGMQEENLYLLITEAGVAYGEKAANRWDRSPYAFPVGEADARLSQELVMEPAPVLGERSILIYRVRSEIDLSNVSLQLTLPPGAFQGLEVEYPPGGEGGTYSASQIWWHGSARANENLELQVTVKVNKTGWGYAYGETRSTELPGNILKAFIYVDKYNGYYEVQDWP